MIQNKPIFWNTIFVTKEVMDFSIFLLSNKQPMIFPQLMHIIPTTSGTSLLSKVSSYIILIFNTENNLNKYFKCSAGHSILSTTCKILHPPKYLMLSIILFGQNHWVSCWSIYFFFDRSLYFLSSFFWYDYVSRLSFHSWINSGWSIYFIYGLIYFTKRYRNASTLSL